MSAHLKSLAYRMLGSAADAEDVVQEAQLRLHQADPVPDNPEAFLYRVISNLCVDKLRAEKVRRRQYVGPWLPEPLVEDDAEVVEVAELAEQLSMGFMLMLERLSPAERVVYVLREGFDFSFAEIAQILDVSVANARQRAHRARKRLGGGEVAAPVPPLAPHNLQQKQMLETFLLKVAERDVEGLVALMSDDVVAYADGGGVVSAAIAPVHGAARIAQVTLHLAHKVQNEGSGPLSFELQPMNGGWGLVVKQGGAVHSCFQLALRDELIHRIYVVRNPHKLSRLG